MPKSRDVKYCHCKYQVKIVRADIDCCTVCTLGNYKPDAQRIITQDCKILEQKTSIEFQKYMDNVHIIYMDKEALENNEAESNP